MEVKELVDVLRISVDLEVKNIAKAIGVCKDTVWRWSNGSQIKNSNLERLEQLIKSINVDVDKELRKIVLAKKIKDEDWSNLIQGILFNFKITQKQLGKIIGVKGSTISTWLNLRRPIPLKRKIKFISFIFENNKSLDEFIELGKKVKNSIIVEGLLIDKTNSVKRSEFPGSLFISIDKKIFLNTPLLFPPVFRGNEIKFIFDRSNVIVFWENKFKEPFPLILPRLIEVNEDLLVGLGLWIAEGTKTREHPKITNSEPVIIQQSIKFFELIGINKEKLNGWIQVHPRSPFKDKHHELKEFWSAASGLRKEQIKRVFIKKERPSVKKVSVKEMGAFNLECDLILSKLIIDDLLLNMENIIQNVPNSELPLLKGIIAGEGWCGQTKQGVVNEISITLKENRWRKLTLNLLSKINIIAKESERDNDITICGFKNFQKLVKLNIFQFHPGMKKRLEEGFILLSQSRIPFRNKERIIELLVSSKNPLTANEISQLLNLSLSNTRHHLIKLFRMNKIFRQEGSGSIPHKWFILSNL